MVVTGLAPEDSTDDLEEVFSDVGITGSFLSQALLGAAFVVFEDQ